MKGCNKTPETVGNSMDSVSTDMSAGMDSMASSAGDAVSSATNAVKKMFMLKMAYFIFGHKRND